MLCKMTQNILGFLIITKHFLVIQTKVYEQLNLEFLIVSQNVEL